MFTNWYVIILIFDLPLCHSTHICRYAKAHIYNFSLVHSSTNTYMMTACRNTNCEQLWHNPFTAQDSKFFAGRIKLFVVGRIVCTVPILDSPTVQPSAGDDASHIKNKPSRVIKTVSQNRRKTTCRANIQFKIFQKQWLHFCKLSLRKPLKIAARRVLSPNRTPFPPPPSNPSTTFGIRNKAILPATLKMRTAHRWFLSRPEARKYCGARTFWRLFLKLTRPDDWQNSVYNRRRAALTPAVNLHGSLLQKTSPLANQHQSEKSSIPGMCLSSGALHDAFVIRQGRWRWQVQVSR